MFCNNCGTQYDVVPLEIGKSKFCRDCGVVLYKNENNSLVFNTIVQNNLELQKQQAIEAEQLKKEQLLRQHQIEIERQAQIEAEKLRQEYLFKQQQIEIEKEKEAERLRQTIIEEQRQLELQRQYALDQERQKQLEFIKQQELALKKRENELLEEKERESLRQQEALEIENQRTKLLNEKEIELQNLKEEILKPKVSFAKFLLISIISVAIGAGSYFLIDRFLLNKSDKIANIEVPSNIIETDALSSEKIKNDLSGNNITGWGLIDTKNITSILSNIKKRNDTTICVASLTLEDNGVKSNAEVTLNYMDSTLLNVITNKITFKNTATPNSWFIFTPVTGCTIFVNTNDNPIQLKTCENCTVIKMNTNSSTAQKLPNHPESIFITSDTKYEAIVDFTYIPEN